MRWHIRTVSRRKKGAVSHSDETFSGGALTIGRAAGQGVFLTDIKVALEHARVVPLKDNRFRVESLVAAGVRVDGKLQSAAGAGVGSTIEIGDNLIEIVKPPEGHDAAVTVSKIVRAPGKVVAGTSGRATTLKETWLGKRKLSWAMFLVALAIGLIIPVAGVMLPGIGDTLRETPGVPSDNTWEAGTLQAAHHFFGSQCDSCHQKPFKRVRDQACVACHAGTPAHADGEMFQVDQLTKTPCAICHRDHNGLKGLVNESPQLCTDCHADLGTTTHGKTILADISDFSTDHPEFKVELAGWDADGSYLPRREKMDSLTLSEDSNLKFPHDIHLAAEGVNAPDGKQVMACGDCHQAEPGGGKMVAVEFETMCQSCHSLAFDPAAPDRQVPHGNASEVMFMLQDYYSNQALRGAVLDTTAPATVRQRRRPGQRISREERMEILAWADERSQRITQSLFEGQACGVCHSVARVTDSERTSWKIAPVRVAGEWFHKARFTHSSHTTMDCQSCHDARDSASSDDVLIPPLANCQSCHGGEKSKNLVITPCVDCHRYHGHDELILAESVNMGDDE